MKTPDFIALFVRHARRHLVLFQILLALGCGHTTVAATAPMRTLEGNLHLLGKVGTREWREFEGRKLHGQRLDITFTAESNEIENTILVRQRDVKLDWQVELNGRRLGSLSLTEADLLQALAVPPRGLLTGPNTLSILPPEGRDDILIGEVRLADKPLETVLTESTLSVQVEDEDLHTALPCRFTLTDLNGSLHPLHVFSSAPGSASAPATPFRAVRTGVIYSTDGTVRLGLPAGSYVLSASRGFEYSVRTNRLTLEPGQSQTLQLRLRHEVPTPGLASCDPHVHTFTYSHHGDATVPERLAALAGEGIELPVATDHNTLTDYLEELRHSGLDRMLTPVIGDEVTTDAGHFNIFPVRSGSRVPDSRILDWPTLMTVIRSTPGVRVVVLNHPRNLHSGFQPFGVRHFNSVTGENRRGAEFSFDAVEVLNSSALQSDLMIGFRDWFALLNYGYRVTAVASSDSHDVSRYIVGQGRTYVYCDDSNPGHLDVETACAHLVKGRALVSLGLLTRLTVDDRFSVGDLATGLGEWIRVSVQVLGPSWVQADRVELYANGLKIRDQKLESPVGPVEKTLVTWIIPRPAFDVHLTAIASGPPVTEPFWALAKPYQPSSPEWEPRVIGATNPVWLDGDGDGKFTPARAYATAAVERAGQDLGRLFGALAGFDEAVAAQAASLMPPASILKPDGEFAAALQRAPAHVQRGFHAYAATLTAY